MLSRKWHRKCNNILQVYPSTKVRNSTESPYPQGLDPLVYDRLEVFSRYEAQDGVSSDTKENISAVRKLYLSKELIPKEGYTMVFKNGQKISDWFDDKLGYSKELMAKLYSEPHVGFYAEKACLI